MNILIKKYEKGISKGVDVGLFGKNTEDIIVIISNYNVQLMKNKNTSEESYVLISNLQFFNSLGQSDSIENIKSKLSQLVVPEDFNLNMVTVLRRISKELESILGLSEGVDFIIQGDVSWEQPDFNFRVTIPDKMLKVPVYASLVSKVLELGVPVKEIGDLNVIYFAQIGETEQFIYNDENILVENNNLK